MTVVTIHKAKTELSKLIARVEKGEEVIIARGNKPVVRLVPIASPSTKKSRGRGAWKGLTLPDTFFEPLTEEQLRDWEGPIEPSP